MTESTESSPTETPSNGVIALTHRSNAARPCGRSISCSCSSAATLGGMSGIASRSTSIRISIPAGAGRRVINAVEGGSTNRAPSTNASALTSRECWAPRPKRSISGRRSASRSAPSTAEGDLLAAERPSAAQAGHRRPQAGMASTAHRTASWIGPASVSVVCGPQA